MRSYLGLQELAYQEDNKEKKRIKSKEYYYSEQGVATRKAYKEKNRDKILAYQREYQKTNKQELKKMDKIYGKEYRLKHKEQCSKKSKECRCIKKYGITLEQYNKMRTETKYCPICGVEMNEIHHDNKSKVLDHCHKTGKIRGILCCACNLALGKFKDDLQIVESAANYLRRMA